MRSIEVFWQNVTCFCYSHFYRDLHAIVQLYFFGVVFTHDNEDTDS